MFPHDRGSSRSLDKTFCDRDDPHVRDKCMKTRLNRPDRLTKNSVTEPILTSETIIRKPGITERRVIALVVGICLKSLIRAINHTPKRLFITKCLKGNASYLSKMDQLSLGQH